MVLFVHFFLRTLAVFLFSLSLTAWEFHRALDLNQPWNFTFSPSRCAHNPDWAAAQCNFKHCVAALQQVWILEKFYNGIEYEFCGHGQRPRTRLEKRIAPQIFKAGKSHTSSIADRTPVNKGSLLPGSCTIAVINLSHFPPDQLPGRPFNHYPETGVAAYSEIFHAAEMVLEKCKLIHCTAGWQPVGNIAQGLGVFVWATESKTMRIMSEQSQEEAIT